MKRKLYVIGNPGLEGDEKYCPGVLNDVDNYLSYFRSDNGGAWDSGEIKSINYDWTPGLLKSNILCDRDEGIDFFVIVFVGHGFSDYDAVPCFELSPGYTISLREIRRMLCDKKVMMIADSCQSFIGSFGSRVPLLEKQFSIPIKQSRSSLRQQYDTCIEQVSQNAFTFVSSVSFNETAGDTLEGGLYSHALLSYADGIISAGSSNPVTYNIKDIHKKASETVIEKSKGTQHPKIELSYGCVYPPFIVL